MPVHIEIIDRNENYNHILLAHYEEQNGDLMRDPEMIFALHKESQQFFHYYYRNDYNVYYMGIEQDSVRWTEKGVLLNRRLQADHTTFANQWLRNIAQQQTAPRGRRVSTLRQRSPLQSSYLPACGLQRLRKSIHRTGCGGWIGFPLRSRCFLWNRSLCKQIAGL